MAELLSNPRKSSRQYIQDNNNNPIFLSPERAGFASLEEGPLAALEWSACPQIFHSYFKYDGHKDNKAGLERSPGFPSDGRCAY